MSLDRPILLTESYLQTRRAQAVPEAYFEGGGWWIPPDPDPETARYALRLFRDLTALHPELVARARLSSAGDFTPRDYALERWKDRPTHEDPWPEVAARCYEHGITPHEFQRIDAQFAIENLDAGKGAYFGHEMGLGKTLAALMVIEAWSNFTLIVCPNSAKRDPWVQHFERFLPELPVVVMGNTPRARAAAFAEAAALGSAGTPFALICHYEALALIEGPNKKGWKPLGQWDLMVVDEAHCLKGRNTKRASSLRRMSRAGTLLLSGSVMSGRAEDLFVPLQILQPRRYTRQWDHWNLRFLDAVETDYGMEIIGPKAHTLPAMRDELGEVLTVRRAADHLSVPEPILVEHEVQMLPAQKQAYLGLANEMLAELPDGTLLSAVAGAPLLCALRRVTAGIEVDGEVLSAKHDLALELIESAGDSQILSFAWHKLPGHELQRRCLAAGISCGRIDGDTPHAERERIIDLFKRGGYRVLHATISTLSTAANLQNAGVVLFLEESYEPSDNEQALARAVRQGQPAHVSAHYLRAARTVDDLRVLPSAVSKAEIRRLVLGA